MMLLEKPYTLSIEKTFSNDRQKSEEQLLVKVLYVMVEDLISKIVFVFECFNMLYSYLWFWSSSYDNH